MPNTLNHADRRKVKAALGKRKFVVEQPIDSARPPTETTTSQTEVMESSRTLKSSSVDSEPTPTVSGEQMSVPEALTSVWGLFHDETSGGYYGEPGVFLCDHRCAPAPAIPYSEFHPAKICPRTEWDIIDNGNGLAVQSCAECSANCRFRAHRVVVSFKGDESDELVEEITEREEGVIRTVKEHTDVEQKASQDRDTQYKAGSHDTSSAAFSSNLSDPVAKRLHLDNSMTTLSTPENLPGLSAELSLADQAHAISGIIDSSIAKASTIHAFDVEQGSAVLSDAITDAHTLTSYDNDPSSHLTLETLTSRHVQAFNRELAKPLEHLVGNYLRKISQVEKDRDTLAGKNAHLERLLETAEVGSRTLTSRVKAMEEEKNRISKEKDWISQEKDRISQERDGLQKQVDYLQKELKDMRRQLEEADLASQRALKKQEAHLRQVQQNNQAHKERVEKEIALALAKAWQ